MDRLKIALERDVESEVLHLMEFAGACDLEKTHTRFTIIIVQDPRWH